MKVQDRNSSSESGAGFWVIHRTSKPPLVRIRPCSSGGGRVTLAVNTDFQMHVTYLTRLQCNKSSSSVGGSFCGSGVLLLPQNRRYRA